MHIRPEIGDNIPALPELVIDFLVIQSNKRKFPVYGIELYIVLSQDLPAIRAPLL